MPTRETENNASLGTATKQVAEHASTLARLELELAQLELKQKVASLGVGIGLGAGAAIFGLFMLGFLFAAIAAGLATAMPTWAALLVTTGILLLLAAILGVLAMGRIRKATPPVPEQAIAEAKRTSEALKSDGHA
jgi:uncharacterized membrane protein YqjE